MERGILAAFVRKLSLCHTVRTAFRVDDNTILIDFEGVGGYLFWMVKGGAQIFIDSGALPPKRYKAPFDMLLLKRFGKAKLLKAELVENERIIRLTVSSEHGYKSETTTLQLEFTGRHTNAILLDDKSRVLAALRYVDESRSIRPVLQGEVLLMPPSSPFAQKEDREYSQEQLDELLAKNFEQRMGAQLSALKKAKLSQIAKKRAALQRSLDALPKKEQMLDAANEARGTATLLLSNMHELKPYMKSVELLSFDGETVSIELPQKSSAAQIPQHFFSLAKRLSQKALGIHREKESLDYKIAFLDRMSETVEAAKSTFELSIVYPKQEQKDKKSEGNDDIGQFWVDDYKILLGKNERGNAQILKIARANDIWMHLHERPSAHVLIRTDKQSVPERVLQQAGKLCVSFSVDQRGFYLVDFAKRKDVRVQESAKALYVNFATIRCEKA